jgi:hypothetical protein
MMISKSAMFEDFVGVTMDGEHTKDAEVHFGGFNKNVITEVKPISTFDVDDDEFSEFEATDKTSYAIVGASSAEFARSSSNNDTSLFDAFSVIPPLLLGNIPVFGSIECHEADFQGDNMEAESFGQFGAFPAEGDDKHSIPSQNDVTLGQRNDEEESFGQFDAYPDEAPDDSTKELSEYSVPQSATQNYKEAMEDGIVFARVGGAADELVLASAVNEYGHLWLGNALGTGMEEDDNFGTFVAFSAPKEDDDFGQFEVFPTTNEDTSFGLPRVRTNAEGAPDFSAALVVHNDDDFGTFGGADTIQSSDGIIDEVVLDHNHDDFDTGFGDFSSFDNATQQQVSGKEVNLEEMICSKIGAEYCRLVEDWKNVISADLQKGNKIMDHLSSSLSSKDRVCIIKSRKFQDHIFGLAEFVRVVRSITATIGDLLCVEKNIDVRQSTLSQWNDNAIIADAIVIDYLWSESSSKARALGISTVPQLESVVEIRARAINFEVSKKGTFCQLTLRPLEGESRTQSPVVWNDKEYMVCAANFCANRGQHMLFKCVV